MWLECRLSMECNTRLTVVALRLVAAEEVVQKREAEWDETLHLDAVLACLSCHLEFALQSPKDPFDHVAKLSMAKIEEFFLILRSTI